MGMTCRVTTFLFLVSVFVFSFAHNDNDGCDDEINKDVCSRMVGLLHFFLKAQVHDIFKPSRVLYVYCPQPVLSS